MSNESADPSHYKHDGWEAIDVIKDVLGEEGFKAYCLGAALKYLLRIGRKDDAKVEAEKAKVYLGWYIEGRKK